MHVLLAEFSDTAYFDVLRIGDTMSSFLYSTLGNGKFRIPSLRNIELTAPYMHDGRFNTLEEVVEHYNTGVKPHNHLDKNLKNTDGSPLRPNLNSLEQKALVAFLKTLTDETTIKDVK